MFFPHPPLILTSTLPPYGECHQPCTPQGLGLSAALKVPLLILASPLLTHPPASSNRHRELPSFPWDERFSTLRRCLQGTTQGTQLQLAGNTPNLWADRTEMHLGMLLQMPCQLDKALALPIPEEAGQPHSDHTPFYKASIPLHPQPAQPTSGEGSRGPAPLQANPHNQISCATPLTPTCTIPLGCISGGALGLQLCPIFLQLMTSTPYPHYGDSSNVHHISPGLNCNSSLFYLLEFNWILSNSPDTPFSL